MRALLFATLFLACSPAPAQLLSDLEPERPLVVQDARPISYRAIAASIDWTYNVRRNLDDTGPGFSLLYGAARGLELGAALRYVTRPGRNALRGISSGDLEIHAVYAIAAESASLPAIAVRLGLQFPTGLDSRGTDLTLSALLTRSFDAFRVHGNLQWTRLGETLPSERADRLEADVGFDFLPSARGFTDTILLAGVAVRSSLLIEGETILSAEFGLRRRVGAQTVFFAGLGSETTGEHDRARLRARAGMSRVF